MRGLQETKGTTVVVSSCSDVQELIAQIKGQIKRALKTSPQVLRDKESIILYLIQFYAGDKNAQATMSRIRKRTNPLDQNDFATTFINYLNQHPISKQVGAKFIRADINRIIVEKLPKLNLPHIDLKKPIPPEFLTAIHLAYTQEPSVNLWEPQTIRQVLKSLEQEGKLYDYDPNKDVIIDGGKIQGTTPVKQAKYDVILINDFYHQTNGKVLYRDATYNDLTTMRAGAFERGSSKYTLWLIDSQGERIQIRFLHNRDLLLIKK